MTGESNLRRMVDSATFPDENLFRYFKTSPETICLAVMMYVRFPLLLRQVEDLLYERGVDICHETVRGWWNRLADIAEWRQIATRTRHDTVFKDMLLLL